jgi:hypothetical protein
MLRRGAPEPLLRLKNAQPFTLLENFPDLSLIHSSGFFFLIHSITASRSTARR